MSCYLGSNHITDLSQATLPGTRYKVDWVDVPDRDARTTSVRMQQFARPVTRSRKLEGAWWGDGGAYFVARFARTSDGSVKEHDGQVWFYDPATESVTLKTIFGVNPDPASDSNYDGPDNITVSPYGGVILAEDGEGIQHLVGVTDQGKAYPLARNQIEEPGLAGGEFAGPTLQRGRADPVRVHPVAGVRVRHHRPMGEAQQRSTLSPIPDRESVRYTGRARPFAALVPVRHRSRASRC